MTNQIIFPTSRWIISVIIILSASWLVLQATESFAADQGKLKLIVQGVREEKGVIRAAMVNSPESFAGEGPYFQEVVIPVNRQEVCYVFADIPFGKYAIKLYHDENDNGKLDTYPLFGIPSEDYGFSNNARATFGRPSFSEAMFVFDKSQEQVLITLQ